jgi:hypothetical protein
MKKTFDNRIEYFNDKEERHRTDGPAIEYFNSENRLWYLNGKHHREDGPAIELNGLEIWYLDGKMLSREDHEKELIKIKLNRLKNL